MRKNRGLVLIELLVVIAIIGLIATISLVSINSAREKAKITKAQADLRQLGIAIEFLYDDTGQHPAHCTLSPCYPCPGGPERYLDVCSAGLECTDGGFPSWNGPYVSSAPLDPWVNRYIFDADYRCYTATKGCEGIPNSTMVRAIHSGGPDGSGINNYSTDNIVYVLCR